MSIYSQLLVEAMGSAERAQMPRDEQQLVADLTRCRARLLQGQLPATAAGGAPAAVANQLAYDLALTALCRRVGVSFDVAEFDRPVVARTRLEHVLVGRGLCGRDTASSGGGWTP